MKTSIGNIDFPIWLLGDSPPDRWKDKLITPLDSLHPIRHNIWTSVLNEIQKEIYQESCKRLDEDKIYIRNAISSTDHRPKRNELLWAKEANYNLTEYRNLLLENKPIIVITFGAMSFEFAIRSLNLEDPRKYQYWNTINLGNAFRKSVSGFDKSKTNIFPLLHRSIAGGYFLESHENFCGVKKNYFEYVGKELAKLITHIID